MLSCENRIAFLFVLAVVAFTSQNQFYSRLLADERPNIVLVITDDQGYGDLSCHGNPVLQTPNLDQLASQSVRFTNFHVSPTCAPTRSALMTGRHEFQNGVTHTILERERMTLAAKTLPESLQQAGYATGIFGKWHLGDEDPYQPDNRGFDEVFIHGGGGIGQKYEGSCADAPPNRGQGKESGYFDPVVRHNGTFVQTKGFCTDVFFQASLGWIDGLRKNEKPFFAYISTNAPHGPFLAPDKYRGRFADKTFKPNNKPDNRLAGFYGMIENIDDNVGLLLKKLDEWKLDKNTIVIFMTDNGSAIGAKVFNADMKGAKGTVHEGGTRVPLFVRWNGNFKPNTKIDKLVAHIDLFPTIANLTGAALPAGDQVQGRSVVPLIKDKDADWDDRYLFVHKGRWPKGADPHEWKYKSAAIRNSRFRLINNEQLFDMRNDPGQKKNVIDEHPEIVAAMRVAYDTWWQKTVPMMVNEKANYGEQQPPFYRAFYDQQNGSGISEWVPPTF